MQYLLYGANGYTGRLIVKESLAQGLKPVLAGRNREEIEAMGREYRLPTQVFELDDTEGMEDALASHRLCVNAAGPFFRTATPLVTACLNTKTHYLDITGEIEVFERLKAMDKAAKEQQIMVMPGVGFDVVPSDCLANYLKEEMPDATTLELGFSSRGGGLSHGTASTMWSHMGEGSAVRRDGRIRKVPMAHKSKTVDFGDFKRAMATIPWGDVSTAYTSTGIPNIEVYTSMHPSTIKRMQYQRYFNPVLRTGLVRKLGQWWIDKNIYGPTEEENRTGRSYLHGQVSNGSNTLCAILTAPEGYLLTAQCTVNIARKVLDQNLHIGYQTPAGAYGWRLILEMPDTEFRDTSCS